MAKDECRMSNGWRMGKEPSRKRGPATVASAVAILVVAGGGAYGLKELREVQGAVTELRGSLRRLEERAPATVVRAVSAPPPEVTAGDLERIRAEIADLRREDAARELTTAAPGTGTEAAPSPQAVAPLPDLSERMKRVLSQLDSQEPRVLDFALTAKKRVIL